MARLNLILPATLIAGLLAAGSAWAENIALVISNGTYEHGSNERAIDRAHRGLSDLYKARGYRVFGGNNLTRADMAREMEGFEARLDDAEIAVVHLVGHTAALGDHGWFLPADLNPNSATDFEMGAVSLDAFAQMLETHDGRAVMFIGSSGSEVRRIRGVDGTIGAVNAPPGLLVVSGLYGHLNAAVEREFLKVDARVSDAMDRYGSRLSYEGYISSRLVLAPRSARPVVTPPRPQPPAVIRTPESIESALGLTRTQRRRVQENLTILGHDTRGVDGVFGRGTRAAIAAWQRSEDLEATSYLTQAQIGRLERRANAERRAQAEADEAYWLETGASGLVDDLNRYLRRYPNGAHADEARRLLQAASTQADQDAWDAARDRDTIRAYERYLERYPDGLYNRAAKARILALGGELDRDDSGRDDTADDQAAEAAARAAERALGMDNGTRLLIELRLVALGYRPGAPDGNFDSATRAALAAFQRDRNMPATGYVNALTITALLRGG